MPELLTMTSWRKSWKRISAESSLILPWRPIRSRDCNVLNWIIFKLFYFACFRVPIKNSFHVKFESLPSQKTSWRTAVLPSLATCMAVVPNKERPPVYLNIPNHITKIKRKQAGPSHSRPRSTFRLSLAIRSVATINQWSGPVKLFKERYHWSAPLVSRSNWSDRTT